MLDPLAFAATPSLWLGLTAAGAAGFLLYLILTDVRDLWADRAKAAARALPTRFWGPTRPSQATTRCRSSPASAWR